MQEAVPVGEGGMLAVLGSDIIEINKYISEIKNKGVCEVANDNAKGQIIISGNINCIKELQQNLKLAKKSILLPVSAPFHCSLMNPAAKIMKDKINSVDFKKPDFEIISNVTAAPENKPEDIKRLLFEQIYSKVRWRESVIFMTKNKIREFVEIGPGKVLTGLVKRISPNTNSFSINSIDDIKKYNNES